MQDLSNSFWSFGQLEIQARPKNCLCRCPVPRRYLHTGQDVALICAAAGRVLPMLSSARPSSDALPPFGDRLTNCFELVETKCFKVAKDLALLAWSLAKLGALSAPPCCTSVALYAMRKVGVGDSSFDVGSC